MRTVQGELQRILGHLYGYPVDVQCAGRTDAGVHARGQVAHVDVPGSVVVDRRRINHALPSDVRIESLEVVSKDFDARFSALWRRYSYRVCDSEIGPEPLQRRHVLAWSRPLDVERMNAAAVPLLGEHDFAAYCKKREFGSTVRGLERLEWRREVRMADKGQGSDAPGLAVLDIQADAFCHSMVRSLVGALLPVGDGRRPIEWPAQVLEAGVRDSAVAVMPAHPLVLEEVGYPPPSQWGARQVRTRVRRDS